MLILLLNARFDLLYQNEVSIYVDGYGTGFQQPNAKPGGIIMKPKNIYKYKCFPFGFLKADMYAATDFFFQFKY